MNINKLFQKLVFGLVVLSVLAFCLAEPNPALLLFAGAICVLSWYVTEGPSARTLPRSMINLGAIAALGWLVIELAFSPQQLVVAVGHFTMGLQILMLYGQKSSRENAQLLVLSMMQMVGASVLPGGITIIFGALLSLYCVGVLVVVVGFHFKTEADQALTASKAGASRDWRPGPPMLRGPAVGRHFRRVLVGLGLMIVTVAVLMFVLIPRDGDSRLDARLTKPAVTAQTGYTGEVDLSGPPIAGGSAEPVLNLNVRTDEEQPIEFENRRWWLRGRTLDVYNPRQQSWTVSQTLAKAWRDFRPRHSHPIQWAEVPSEIPMLTAQFTLRQTGNLSLFSIAELHTGRAGPVRYTSNEAREIAFNFDSQDLRLSRAAVGATLYELTWPARPVGDLSQRYLDRQQEYDDQNSGPLHLSKPRISPSHPDKRLPWTTRPGPATTQPDTDADASITPSSTPTPSRFAWPVKPKRVQRMAQRILSAHGLDRDEQTPPERVDVQRMQKLADHLRHNYSYDLQHPRPPEDPVIAFLFSHRRGHCELFASALVALSRSVGIHSRMVTGYVANEYNEVGGYYVVRQEDAHAWVEFDAGPVIGWRSIDPTPSAGQSAPDSLMLRIRQLYEHLEFVWIKSVVAFDSTSRQQLLDKVPEAVNESMGGEDQVQAWMNVLTQWARNLRAELLALVLLLTVTAALAVALGSLALLLLARRRRARALQTHTLDGSSRRRLTRELQFYLSMLEMLENHGIHRPHWQTPREFALELSHANPMRFDPVVALTDSFYAIRFGGMRLGPDDHQRNQLHLTRLSESLRQRPTG